jgi:hypothetical protein
VTATDTIIDLDLFRRIRQAVSDVTSPAVRTANPTKAADWYLSGFCGRERIGTTFGDLPIEALRARDELRTYQGNAVTVKAVDQVKLDWDFIRNTPRALPIRIPANSFGPGKPLRDLLVSPGQEVSPDIHVPTTFLSARNLIGRFAMDFTQNSGFSYFRFHCGAPAIVKVEGIWVRVDRWT